MTFREFDDATPRMVRLWVNAYIERAEEQRDSLVLAAWHGARFQIAGSQAPGLGPVQLHDALNFGKPKARRTWEEESARWDGFFAGARSSKGQRRAKGA